MTEKPVDPLYDAKDMARIFALKDWRSAYKLPIRKIRRGRRVQWAKSDVDLYLALHTEDAA